MKNHPYLFSILQKIHRTNIRDNFNKIVSMADGFTPYYTNLFLDCLVMAVTKDSKIGQPEETLNYFKNNFSEIAWDWEHIVAKFTQKFSTQKTALPADWGKIHIILDLVTHHKDGLTFLKELSLQISLAETRGVPFDEPRVEVPNSLLPTSKRYSFFEALVPLNTKWR